MGPSGLVIALEPQAAMMDVLVANVDLAGTPAVKPLLAAVGLCGTGGGTGMGVARG